MGPKGKKDRNSVNSTNSKEVTPMPPKNHDRLEQLQADHELFLQAFESKCFTLPVQFSNCLSIYLQLIT